MKDTLVSIILIMICFIATSCHNNETSSDNLKDIHCDCQTGVLNELFFTTHDIENLDSILIGMYEKHSEFKNFVSTKYYKIDSKNRLGRDEPLKGWEFSMENRMDTKYDYKFYFPEKHDTIEYNLGDLTLRQVVVGSINGNPAIPACILGSWTINGHKFNSGNITFK